MTVPLVLKVHRGFVKVVIEGGEAPEYLVWVTAKALDARLDQRPVARQYRFLVKDLAHQLGRTSAAIRANLRRADGRWLHIERVDGRVKPTSRVFLFATPHHLSELKPGRTPALGDFTLLSPLQPVPASLVDDDELYGRGFVVHRGRLYREAPRPFQSSLRPSRRRRAARQIALPANARAGERCRAAHWPRKGRKLELHPPARCHALVWMEPTSKSNIFLARALMSTVTVFSLVRALQLKTQQTGSVSTHSRYAHEESRTPAEEACQLKPPARMFRACSSCGRSLAPWERGPRCRNCGGVRLHGGGVEVELGAKNEKGRPVAARAGGVGEKVSAGGRDAIAVEVGAASVSVGLPVFTKERPRQNFVVDLAQGGEPQALRLGTLLASDLLAAGAS